MLNILLVVFVNKNSFFLFFLRFGISNWLLMLNDRVVLRLPDLRVKDIMRSRGLRI